MTKAKPHTGQKVGMLNKVIQFIRSNAIALLSLFIALGGTSYAAVNLPAGSVGTRQLRNGAITPAKLDGHTIGGSVRNWAFVNQDGTILGGSHGARASAPAQLGQPYAVNWGDQFARSCAVLTSSPGFDGHGPIADTVATQVNEPGRRHGATVILVRPSDNNAFVDARFYIAVVC